MGGYVSGWWVGEGGGVGVTPADPPVGDEPPVLHGSGSKVWDGDQIWK